MTTPADHPPARRPARRKLLFRLLLLLISLLVLEVGLRAVWALQGVPLFGGPDRFLRRFYPDLGVVADLRIERDDTFDVLLLGASVVWVAPVSAPWWVEIGPLLEERLAAATGRQVRVHTVATPAHTSRDSLFKYRYLKDKHFDLVLVYHGINELRANNCPPEMFRDDYSHFSWYRQINPCLESDLASFTVIPYSIRFAINELAVQLGWADVLSTHTPRQEWLEFGADIRTAKPFGDNLRALCRLAAERGEPVMLITFATYVPADYSHQKFRDKELDYALSLFPIELWGRPDHVVRGIGAHNEQIRRVAAEFEHVYLTEQVGRIPQDKEHFHDICHFAPAGSERFVDNLVERLLEQGLAPR